MNRCQLRGICGLIEGPSSTWQRRGPKMREAKEHASPSTSSVQPSKEEKKKNCQRPRKRGPLDFPPQSRTFRRSETTFACDLWTQGIDSGSERGNKRTICFFSFTLTNWLSTSTARDVERKDSKAGGSKEHFFSRPLEKKRAGSISFSTSLLFPPAHAFSSALSLSNVLSPSHTIPQPFF